MKDGYELQQDLIGHIRETEKARNDFSNAVRQMEDGKSPQPTAPEPQSGRVSTQPPSYVQPGVASMGVNNRDEIREFLGTRRSKITRSRSDSRQVAGTGASPGSVAKRSPSWLA